MSAPFLLSNLLLVIQFVNNYRKVKIISQIANYRKMKKN